MDFSCDNKEFVWEDQSDDERIIWRYIDITKFEDLLDTSSLYFSSARQFADKFEGAISSATLKNNLVKNIVDYSPDYDLLSLEQPYEDLRRLVKISCWHINNYESAAMWRQYLNEGRGVAIISTIKDFFESLDEYKIEPHYGCEKIWFGEVKYIDYKSDKIDKNMLKRFFFKRKSFSYESEFRAVVSLRMAQNFCSEIPEKGIRIKVNLNSLIKEIRVAPEMDQNFVTHVNALLKKYRVNKEVNSSDLDEQPLYAG